MYLYETHLHTAPMSGCAKVGIRETLEYYQSAGYAGVFLTNHFLDGNIDMEIRELAYAEQIEALVEGGVDLLLVETAFDTLNVKAAMAAAEQVFACKGRRLPIMLSVTIADAAGRMLAGQTLEAFLCSTAHFKPFSVGLNCSFGAEQMLPFLKQIASAAPCYISAYPNAGIPDQMGRYDQTPEIMARNVAHFAELGLVNIVGGCCGTDPAFIAGLRDALM